MIYKMKNLKITIEFWKEDNLYIANCPELDMLAQGESLEKAKNNLYEVIEIQFENGALEEFFAFG